MAKANPRKMIEKIYAAFSRAHDDLSLRTSLLIQAISVMDPICGSLQRLQRQNPGVKYLPDDAVKIWNIAGKCRARALGTQFPEEKETSLRMALKYMERFAVALNPPQIQSYIDKLENKQTTTTSTAKAKKAKTGGGTSAIPPIGPDGLPAWLPNTSIRFCAELLVKYPSITLDDAIAELIPNIKSSNPAGRLKMVAGHLVRLGIIRKVKIGGKAGYARCK